MLQAERRFAEAVAARLPGPRAPRDPLRAADDSTPAGAPATRQTPINANHSTGCRSRSPNRSHVVWSCALCAFVLVALSSGWGGPAPAAHLSPHQQARANEWWEHQQHQQPRQPQQHWQQPPPPQQQQHDAEPPAPTSSDGGPGGLVWQLRGLKAALDAGALSDTAFSQAKAELIARHRQLSSCRPAVGQLSSDSR